MAAAFSPPIPGAVGSHPARRRASRARPDQSALGERAGECLFSAARRASDFSLSGDEVRYSGSEDWGFDRFILHHAMLAKAAGGVESFLIGSEMVALNQVRSSRTTLSRRGPPESLGGEARALARAVGEALLCGGLV
jgi:hypothetical protein